MFDVLLLTTLLKLVRLVALLFQQTCMCGNMFSVY